MKTQENGSHISRATMHLSLFHKLFDFRFAIAAFLVPVGIRAIPEILVGSYPIGFDPMNYYVTALLGRQAFRASPFFGYTPFYWYLQSAFNSVIVRNPLLTVKLLGPMLQGCVSGSIYAYSVKGLRLGHSWSLLWSLLATSYFIGLTIAWQEYRLLLGTTFLFLTLTFLSSAKPFQYASVGGALATAVSHDMATGMLLLILSWRAVTLVSRKKLTDLRPMILPLSIAGFYFLNDALGNYSLKTGWGQFAGNTLEVNQASTFLIPGFALWAFLPLLPLLIAGLAKREQLGREMRSWLVLGISTIVLIMVFFPGSMAVQYLGIRLTIFLVYPLALLAVIGFRKLVNYRTDLPRHTVLRAIGIICLVLIAVFSATFLALSPDRTNPYYSSYNPYLVYVPSSMLQNSVSPSDMQSLMNTISWIHQRLAQNQMLIVHEAFEGAIGLSFRYPIPNNIQIIRLSVVGPGALNSIPQELIQSSSASVQNGYSQVFTIWWLPGLGWYGMPSLPASFSEVYASGTFAVYSYSPSPTA